MSDQPDNIMLVYLRRIDAKLDQVNETLRDHGRRITALEIAVANLGASLASYVANSSLRADNLEARVERIERRLDLAETTIA